MTGPPPGRSGRLLLRRRMETAERASDLLDRKLRALRAEHDRLRLRAERTGQEWRSSCQEADRLVLRAALLGGRRALDLAADGRFAELEIRYTVTMGVHYPAEVTLTPPACGPRSPGGAVAAAQRACTAALAAACRHAAAEAAAAAVAREIAVTRRRLRAVERRWLPRLRTALNELETLLEEQEREDDNRLRRATGRLRS